jgi:hypothetical protein
LLGLFQMQGRVAKDLQRSQSTGLSKLCQRIRIE